jgi:hypothetical protein
MDIKAKVMGQNPNVVSRDVSDFLNKEKIDNIYEALAIINKRSNQLTIELKDELRSKLEDFTQANEAIEEIIENKEQIEITRFYERLPNPAIIATEEFLNDELMWEYRDEEGNEIE